MDLVVRYLNRSDLLLDLEHTARNLQKSLTDSVEVSASVRSQPNPDGGASRPRLDTRLSENDIRQLVQRYKGGETATSLAGEFDISRTSIKHSLREQKARRCDQP
ncbi:helix-turn-helix domain-containing protein [Actinomadura rubrisoli]|uniref:helix-turn-helix domain-containing protein n=1 Tax=Actinomadura rubrisoli TaxID=2530368 RepID=UPI001405602F